MEFLPIDFDLGDDFETSAALLQEFCAETTQAINTKEIGIFRKEEHSTGKTFFFPWGKEGKKLHPVKRKILFLTDALAQKNSCAHDIEKTDSERLIFTHFYGIAMNFQGRRFFSLPNKNIDLEVDKGVVIITSTIPLQYFTNTMVVLEYIRVEV